MTIAQTPRQIRRLAMSQFEPVGEYKYKLLKFIYQITKAETYIARHTSEFT
jgi:hypothetical protein